MARDNMNMISITLGGVELPIRRCMLRQNDLSFYAKNPRVYSIVWDEGEEPSQIMIQNELERMDHVKELVQSIEANDGLLDPLLVRDGDFVVLEGNSRLAAYRILEKRDALRWAKVKCDVVPESVTDREIFALLTQYHIVGRKDWAPYEQAGIFWRRWKEEKYSKEDVVNEAISLGLSKMRVRHMIEVYDFMKEKNDAAPSRWSYYDEYLKSRDIQRKREQDKNLDEVIVRKIKTGEIARADDIRKKITKIVKTDGKTYKTFVNKERTMEDCYERACTLGADNVWLQRIEKFQKQLQTPEVKDCLGKMTLMHRNKCLFALKRIHKRSKHLIELLENQ